MSSEHDDLQALFDDTASPPDPVALQRMARAAAQIPKTPVPWYAKLWSPRPVALGAALAAAVALVWVVRQDDTTVAPVASAPALPSSDDVPDDLNELLAFELSDDVDGSLVDEPLAVLDADPLAAWDEDDGLDDAFLSALDVLIIDDDDDVELLGLVFDDMLTEGG